MNAAADGPASRTDPPMRRYNVRTRCWFRSRRMFWRAGARPHCCSALVKEWDGTCRDITSVPLSVRRHRLSRPVMPAHQRGYARLRRAMPGLTSQKLRLISIAKKILYQLRHGIGLLEVRQVSGAIDQLDPRACNTLREFLRVSHIDDAVDLAPDDQGRRGNPVHAVLETAVGNRPDELPGASLRPDRLRERVDPLRRIVRYAEEALRRVALGIGEQRSPALGLGEQHPVLHRQVVAPQSDRIDQHQPAA